MINFINYIGVSMIKICAISIPIKKLSQLTPDINLVVNKI